jgi:protein translocase SecG subunit
MKSLRIVTQLDARRRLSYNFPSRRAVERAQQGNALLKIFISIIQIVACLLLVVLMAIQTDKAEQGGGGVMGLGASSGRTSGNVNMAVGAERILKPLTGWAAFGILASSILNAIPNPTAIHCALVFGVYIVLMLFGNKLWAALTGSLGR